ncbi:MAG: DUF3458 domain-containing protein, partial [Verrucomicrobia bacterium]|nr:DUF3458 domain-containing protein [Verrucomicrobiota bacterium]
TYVKGREVFRAMQTILNSQVPDGFRKAQNLYFERYDGQAVTFRELLNAANEILAQAEKQDLSQFERWFTQQGTPRIHAQMHFHPDAQMCELSLTQSCPHPRTLMEQEPLLIPFSYEMFRKDGSVAVAQEEIVLSEKEHRICIPSEEALIPLFLHNYPAPVILDASYSLEDLSCLVRFATDPFARWDAHHNYSLLALSLAHDRTQADPDADCSDLYEGVVLALQNEHLSPLEKAQMLQVPSLRALSQRTGLYDFGQLEQTRTLHRKGVALACKPLLLQWLKSSPPPDPLVATAEEMAIRRLRNVCWDLLTLIEPERLSQTLDEEMGTPNFDTTLALFRLLLDRGSPQQLERMAPFYHRCKTDKVLLTHWLRAHASSSRCTVADLRKLMQLDGFVGRNPNHIRAVSGAFAYNLARYHDEKGEGYAFLVDQILAVSAFNPHLANRLAQDAFIDFERLPEKQRALMRKEMQRLLVPAVPPEIRALVSATLDGAHAA